MSLMSQPWMLSRLSFRILFTRARTYLRRLVLLAHHHSAHPVRCDTQNLAVGTKDLLHQANQAGCRTEYRTAVAGLLGTFDFGKRTGLAGKSKEPFAAGVAGPCSLDWEQIVGLSLIQTVASAQALVAEHTFLGIAEDTAY